MSVWKEAWKEIPSREQVKISVIKIAAFCFDTAAMACSCQSGFKIVFRVAATESPSQLLFQNSAWLFPNPCNNNGRLLKIPRKKKKKELNQFITFRIIFVDSLFPSAIPSHLIMKVRLRFYLASVSLVVQGIEISGFQQLWRRASNITSFISSVSRKKGNIPWKDNLLVLIM